MDARVGKDGGIIPKSLRIFPLQPCYAVYGNSNLEYDTSSKVHEAICVYDSAQHRKLIRRFQSYLNR